MNFEQYDKIDLHLMSTVDLQDLKEEILTSLSHGTCIDVPIAIELLSSIDDELAAR